MSLADMLLQIDAYPDVTPNASIDQAVEFARLVGGGLAALAVAVDLPVKSNRLADYLVGLTKLEKDEEAKSLAAARGAIDHFTVQAKTADVFTAAVVEKAALYRVPELVAKRARTRDFCIVPLGGRFDGQAEVAVTAIFDSGRPVLVYKGERQNFTRGALEEVVVAWDGGRSAARALADALPILQRAKAVRLLTIAGEKPDLPRCGGADAVRHLRSYGIEAAADRVAGEGHPISTTLGGYLDDRCPDLLVMGAYGHSRLREFILGGATEFAVQNAPVPIFFSH
ncbi:universal stress protein [Phenylobacterium sp. LjRoot225]|uniref:universal stress protein n=1 Tax=Phenylobacterium sp. LjRoot225 TaxID=3342285 RepID=UPI003ECE4817